jgi:hypothetical protein
MSDPSPLLAAHESAPTPCETEVHSVTRASSPEPVFHNHPLHPSLLPYLPPVFPPPGRFRDLHSPPESTPRYITTLPSILPGLSWAAQTPSGSDMLPPDMSTPPPHYRPEGWDHYGQFAPPPPPPPDYHLSNPGWSHPQEHPESQVCVLPPVHERTLTQDSMLLGHRKHLRNRRMAARKKCPASASPSHREDASAHGWSRSPSPARLPTSSCTDGVRSSLVHHPRPGSLNAPTAVMSSRMTTCITSRTTSTTVSGRVSSSASKRSASEWR